MRLQSLPPQSHSAVVYVPGFWSASRPPKSNIPRPSYATPKSSAFGKGCDAGRATQLSFDHCQTCTLLNSPLPARSPTTGSWAIPGGLPIACQSSPFQRQLSVKLCLRSWRPPYMTISCVVGSSPNLARERADGECRGWICRQPDAERSHVSSVKMPLPITSTPLSRASYIAVGPAIFGAGERANRVQVPTLNTHVSYVETKSS